MKGKPFVQRYRTKDGTLLWEVGTSDWNRRMLLNDEQLRELSTIAGKAIENDESD